jgi:hypothetical protein
MPEAHMDEIMAAYREWYSQQIEDEKNGSLIPTKEA